MKARPRIPYEIIDTATSHNPKPGKVGAFCMWMPRIRRVQWVAVYEGDYCSIA